jgi:peptidoglycan/xylan/chitin deacetylase (PgdA/CDA1 family)
MFTFDVDAETTWANGNRSMPNGNRYIRSLSLGQYGPKRCVDRILEMLDLYGVKATFFVPGWTAEHYEGLLEKLCSRGHEIAQHGYLHERFYDYSRAEQEDIIDKSQEIFLKLTGRRAEGFRTPSGDWSEFTPLLFAERNFLYSSSMRGDDRPYRTIIEGRPSDFIEIPTRWELDDYVQTAYNYYPAEPDGQDRISGYDTVADNFLRELAGYRRFGLCCVFMFHPQVIGAPGKIFILEKLLRQLADAKDVWVTVGSEVARWWRESAQ